MSQRERIVAQLILKESGIKMGWNDLSPDDQDRYLEEARARILVQDQSPGTAPEYADDELATPEPAEEPVDAKQRAMDDFQEHISRVTPSPDWEGLREGFGHGYDLGYAGGYKDGWDAAAAAAVGAVTTSLGEDTRLLPRLDVAVTARGLHRRSASLIPWGDLADSQRKSYMDQAVALLRGRMNKD